MIPAVQTALDTIVGRVTTLEHASGAGRIFELFVMTSIARGLRDAAFSVWLQRSDGTIIRSGDADRRFIQRGGAPAGVPASSAGPGNASVIGFRWGRRRKWEIWNGIQFAGRSAATHEIDISIVPGSVGAEIRKAGGIPVGRPRVAIECKDVGTAGSLDEMRAFIARLYDVTLLHAHHRHMHFPDARALHPGSPNEPKHRAIVTYWQENRRTKNIIARRTGFTWGSRRSATIIGSSRTATLPSGAARSMIWCGRWSTGRAAMAEPDEFTRKQSEDAIRLYTAYRHELDHSAIGGRFMPYHWWRLPDPLGGIWMAYSSMLSDYASELANIINDLTHDVHRLRAWARVAAALSDQEKLAVSHEFIDTLGTVALGRPYAIKSRFAYAAGHLCHQANMAKDLQGWLDEFPTERALYLNHIDPICRGWRRFRSFKRRVEPIAGTAFKEATEDFRNAYNHRFSARFLIGMSEMVTRIVCADGRICYGIGGSEPLNLDQVADLLAVERDHCYRAFEAFQSLVEEHTGAITSFESERERQGPP